MKNVKKLMMLLLMCCISIYSMAQTTITGKVTSSKDNSELMGVSVSVRGTALGTATDNNGNFSLAIPTEKAVLVFKYLGFKDQQVSISGNTRNLKVEMNEDTQLLGEVVIVSVGYGNARKNDLTGAISSIGSEDIKKSMSTSLEQAMQGRLAGVQVMQNSGQPGGGVSVSIRGINSLNGNEPLYVIDGVAISGQTNSNLSVLTMINPADIVSIDVLKDASAAAIYGSRASNGVIMITTKQGTSGKPQLSYDGYFGLQQLPTKVEIMNLSEYAAYYNARAAIQGWGIRDDFRDPSLLGPGTDWQKELFRTAQMNNHTISVGGGSGGVRYMLSGGFLNQDGIGLGSNYRRFTFRSNVDMEITKWLNIGVQGAAANFKQIVTMDASGVISAALNAKPDTPARNADGSFGIIQQDQFNTYTENPLASVLLRENYNTGTNLNYNFFANLKPLKGLNFRIEYLGYLNYNNSYQFKPNYTFGNQKWQSESDRSSGKNFDQTLKTYLTYDWKMNDKNNLQIMAGHEAEEYRGDGLSGKRINYISNSVHTLTVGTTVPSDGNSDWVGHSALESWFGRLQYNFADRYLLTASYRADASSTFGPNNKWGTFPSAALAWRIKNESFLKDVEWINNMKLRFGWGVNGGRGGAGSFAYGTAMTTTDTNWGKGFLPSNYGNPNLKWEQTDAYNVGLDLTLFKNRVDFTVEAYYKNTRNLILQSTLPTYIVYMETWLSIQPPWVNTGSMTNRGLEFTLNTVNINKKDLSWKSSFTLSFNRNKLTKLYGDADVIYGDIGGTIYTKTAVGEPIGQIFGYNVIGMFTKEDDFYQKDANGNFKLDDKGNKIEVARPGINGVPYAIAENSIWVGDYIFEDVNKDGVIDEKDRKVLGNTIPKFDYGINNTVSWKDFELNVGLNGVYGNKEYNMLRQRNSGTDGYSNKLKAVANFARIETIDPTVGTDVLSNVYVSNAATAYTERVYRVAGNKNDNERVSSRFVEDGSFLRVKNVSLSYSIPRTWLQKVLNIDFLQVYANVQNLYTFTKYKGYDPEVSSYSIMLRGIDNYRYPTQRIYNFGLRFNF